MLGGVANLNTLAGLACFGFAFLLYSLLLQRLLNLAQTILALQYVCVIVALNEPISAVGGWAWLLSSWALESFRLRCEFFGEPLADQKRRNDQT